MKTIHKIQNAIAVIALAMVTHLALQIEMTRTLIPQHYSLTLFISA